MPLLGKQPYLLSALPSDSELEKDPQVSDVFQIAFTKEIFIRYDDYLRKLDFYKKRQWSCANNVSSKSNLTFEEALNLELKAREDADKLPSYYRRKTLQMSHRFTGRLDNLVDKVFEYFSHNFMPGEKVLVSKPNVSQPVSGTIKLQKTFDDENALYEVSFGDDETQVVGLVQISRVRNAISKTMIKSFLKDALNKEFIEGLNTFLVKPEFRDSNELTDEFNQLDLAAESKIKEKKRLAVAAKQVETRKYPIEDSELIVDEVHILPTPSRDYVIPRSFVGNSLSSWLFLFQYGNALKLYPFTFDEFEISLGRDSVDHLISCSFESLLAIILKERRRIGQGYIAKVLGCSEAPVYSEVGIEAYTENIYARERGWYDRDIDKDLWPLILCGLLQEIQRNSSIRKYNAIIGKLSKVEQDDEEIHLDLDIQEKTEILKILIDFAVDTETIRNYIESEMEKVSDLRRHLKDVEYEKRKLDRERKESEKKQMLKDEVLASNQSDDGESDVADEDDELSELQRKLNDTVSRVERIQIIKEIKEKKEQIAKEQREKLEQATFDEKVLVKKITQLKRDIKSHAMPRVKCLGRDRNHSKYWFFDIYTSVLDFGCGRLFVESMISNTNSGEDKEDKSSNIWSYYHTRDQYEELVNALNMKGIRENSLLQALKRHDEEICHALKVRESQVNFVVNQEDSRRSKRIKRGSSKNASGYVNHWRVY